MVMSKSAIKLAKWKTKQGRVRGSAPEAYSYEGPLNQMDIERFIDGELVPLRVYAPPRHRSERNALERKIGTSCFIRQHWDNLTEKFGEEMGYSKTRNPNQSCEFFMQKLGALAIASPIADIGPGKPAIMLIFFEDDDAAMSAVFSL